jgi:hypothetical protein
VAPKYHRPPISGGDRKALTKEISKPRAMANIFAERSAENRREGEALIREADNVACQSWNESMWSDGGSIDPSSTVDQAINGGYPMLRLGYCAEQWSRHASKSFVPPKPSNLSRCLVRFVFLVWVSAAESA